MYHELTLVPAYNRDYTSENAVLADWRAGKDFRIECVASPDNGKYASIQDIKHFPGKQFKIRFDKLSRFILIDILTGVIHGEAEDAQ